MFFVSRKVSLNPAYFILMKYCHLIFSVVLSSQMISFVLQPDVWLHCDSWGSVRSSKQAPNSSCATTLSWLTQKILNCIFIIICNMHLSTLPSYHHYITIGYLQSAESQVSPQLAKWPALCTHSTTALCIPRRIPRAAPVQESHREKTLAQQKSGINHGTRPRGRGGEEVPPDPWLAREAVALPGCRHNPPPGSV